MLAYFITKNHSRWINLLSEILLEIIPSKFHSITEYRMKENVEMKKRGRGQIRVIMSHHV